MRKRLVIGTSAYQQHGKPFTKAELQFAFDLLEKKDMHPFWYRTPHGLVVARPVLQDDPETIIHIIGE